ncbi:MAG: signal recognition particle-docking protein FtsY [Ignavibacteriales bacterium]|jgi:fused signal recognition particle receptor|nr:signal recognition particle-docking protein FtsY [Ignavibacteriaceae bacterium]NLH62018.1 signal recognition particle-docking protein FtsY [Ignavibacteriales bacterium]HOJ17659.1 signal recognition particle-docking protein FtsY [Ignavibacteriaceae bacterium]HPO56129.1 signal recognition particle-docking protein FtsY [Ignavibacteriaceae bacterium]
MKLFKNINIDKLKTGLNKTREKIVNKISETFSGKAIIDETFIDRIEEVLISADLGVEMTELVIEDLKTRMKKEEDRSTERMIEILKKALVSNLSVNNLESFDYTPDIESNKPFVILIVGVNGVGKTTTVGKLAYNFRQSGLSVIIGAADTFRAAANEQLTIWADRANVEIVSKEKGSDPSAVAYETVSKAISQKHDIAIIDTAGRLHNKSNLMEELSKIKRVISKLIPHAPDEIFLVLDGATGQNALIQAQEFMKTTKITGLIITKLDGTAKGGVVFQIIKKLKIPVRYIGVGEGITDLQNFDPVTYVNVLC